MIEPALATPSAAHDLRVVRARVIGLVLLVTAVGIGLVAVLALQSESLAADAERLGALQGPILTVLGALLVMAMVPAGLVAGAAGYAFGTVVGTLVAVLATTLGAIAATAIGRAVGTPLARSAFGARVERTTVWLEARPGRTVVLARLLPGMPFNVTSYILGFTRIPLLVALGGTALGYLPRSFAYAALGGSLRDLDRPEARAAIAASAVIAIAVTILPRLLVGRLGAGPGRTRDRRSQGGDG